MIGKFERKTLKISGVHNFDSKQFLRRLQKSSINAGLSIIINGKTNVYLSIFDKFLLRKSNIELKSGVIKNLLDGCSFDESILPYIPGDGKALIHVVGTPIAGDNQIEELVVKLLDTEIKSCIFVNLSPVQVAEMECPFHVSFSIAVSGSDQAEMKKNVATVTSMVQAIYDSNSIRLIVDRRPSRNIKKLAGGGHVYCTVLDLEHTSAYFQVPLAYGIEPVKKMDFPTPVSPFKGIDIGELAEFNIPEISKVRIDPERLSEHMAVWGASGTGKTTFLKNLLAKLEKTDVKFCVIDWHNEYRAMVRSIDNQLGEGVLILNPFLGLFSLNPLELPDIKEPREVMVWERIENFISLVKQMFILGEVQEAKLRESLSTLYQNSDAPTIKEAIMTMNVRKMKSLTLKLEKFSLGFYGEIFNCRQSSISFEELRKNNVILELGQLPAEVRMFFTCVFLILWWDNLKINSSIQNVLVLDDFSRYSDFSVVKKMLSESRKFKQGIICSHQGPYQLPQGIREEVIRNTSIKIIFRQEQTWDKHIVRDALGGLDKEQLISLSYLETGQAIAKLPSMKFPIRINVPPPQKLKIIRDYEVKKAMKVFLGEPAYLDKIEFEEPLEKRMLEEINKNPIAPLTELTKSLGIKTIKGYILKDKLVEEGYLIEDKIRQGKGRPRICLRLTKEGLEFIDKESKQAPQYGKSEHIYIKNKIASILKDWKVKLEDGCDIRAEKDGLKVAIEVETGKSNEKEQILYNLERDSKWADKIVIVCPNKRIKLNISELLGAKTQETTILTYRELDNISEILKL